MSTKLKPRYWVSETYSEITPESAEHGDFSDTGYEYGYDAKNKYRQAYSLKELIKSFVDRGDYTNAENFQPGQASQSLYAGYNTSDYRTGTERENALHVTPMGRRNTKAFKRASRHLNRALKKYLK